MSKSRRDNRGNTREQRLLNENTKLKKQLSKLRKQLCRIDLDRHAHLRDIIEEHYHEEDLKDGKEILEKVKQEWKCHCCVDGYLEISPYSKMGETWYYRICSNAPICKNRTKSQPYDPNKVEGLIRKSS